jgi:hypothetical protein
MPLSRASGVVDSSPNATTTSSTAKPSTGPADTDFSSRGYKISKVVRIERSLNAQGIAARLTKSKKAPRYVELPTELEPSEKGEYFIITWKYSGKNAPRTATIVFDYKLSDEETLRRITRNHSNLDRGTDRLRIENIGESYRQKGRIQFWRVTILADGQLVARKESFLWHALHGKEQADSEK